MTDRSRFSIMGGCTRCFRGDHIDPPAMCGECEDDAWEAEREAAHEARQEALDEEFHDMCDALDADRAKIEALGGDAGPTWADFEPSPPASGNSREAPATGGNDE